MPVLHACAPRLSAIPGSEFNGPLPDTRLNGQKILRFRWDYVGYNGTGSVRFAAPDSARLDLFPAGGIIQLSATLIGKGPLCSPQGEATTEILPSPEMAWAALGRLAVANTGDTVKRVSEGILRADIGTNPRWRVTFDGARLAILEKAEGRKVVERVTRGTDGSVTYMRGRRRLVITEVREENAEFSPDIWRC